MKENKRGVAKLIIRVSSHAQIYSLQCCWANGSLTTWSRTPAPWWPRWRSWRTWWGSLPPLPASSGLHQTLWQTPPVLGCSYRLGLCQREPRDTHDISGQREWCISDTFKLSTAIGVRKSKVTSYIDFQLILAFRSTRLLNCDVGQAISAILGHKLVAGSVLQTEENISLVHWWKTCSV